MPTFDPVVVEPSDHLVRVGSPAKGETILSQLALVNGLQDSSKSSALSSVDDDVLVADQTLATLACRLPGAITSPSELWEFLYKKKSAQSSVPPERFNIGGFYHPDGSRAGAMNVDGGYFLKDDVRQFDNSFFGINNLEATHMDPQQRKLLEVVYECFENSGISMEDMYGTNTAVYVGNFTVDYQAMQTRDPDYLHRYAATGTGTAIMSNRISHVFNLQGPSLTLDTACSSSIYALHHAVAAIKNGDCDGAIIAGANLITSPEQHMGTMKGGVLSPTSTCHTFDTSADGYGRAEGVNAIYIKSLSLALKQGNRIRSIIRGTAINASGKTPGITLPSATMQEAVIRKAYQNAGLGFAGTDYIECHGTGTAVGDPIEVDGLASCFTPREGPPLIIGSVKTNLGHSEAASGLTSIMKVVLSFEQGKIPPTYGVKNLNPKLKLDFRNMKVNNDNEKWPRALQRASINSFGYGGANAHVILESVDSYLDKSPQAADRDLIDGDEVLRDQFITFPISAASIKSLDARLQQVSLLVQQSDTKGLRSLVLALGKQQSGLRLRDFILASTSPKPTLLPTAEGAQKTVQGAQPLPFAFVFTGQGAQYAGMAKELLVQNAAFLARIRELDQVLQSLPSKHIPSWTLEQTILDPPAESKVNDVTRSQPLCTAVQIALVDLLRSWGITPSALIGHSSGEIGASYSAGLINASQAILAAYFRGFVVGQLKSRGAMMAAGVGAGAANTLIQDKCLKEVIVACVNAPESVTLSGSESDIQTLQTELQNQKKFARKLETGGRAYHSHMMVDVGDLYEQLLTPYFNNKTTVDGPKVIMHSTVGSTPNDLGIVDSSTDIPAYFRRNLEQPVQFSSVLARLMTGSGKVHLIEIGPHSALKGPIQQIRSSVKLDEDSIPYTSTLVRNNDANLSLKKLAGILFTHGYDLNWQAVNSFPESQLIVAQDLPPYPWDYSKGLLWHEPRASMETRNRKHLRHELLGTQSVAGNGIDWSWRNILRLSEMPWMRDHMLESQVVFPGAGYIALAIEALSQVRGLKEKLTAGQAMSFEGQNINISAPLVVYEEGDAEAQNTELHTTMSQRKISTANVSADWYDFSVSSWTSGQSTLHCMGSIRVAEPAMDSKQGTVLVTDTEGYDAWSMSRWYEKLREEGLCFGPQFQSLISLHTDGNRIRTDAIATTQLEPPVSRTAGTYYAMHPITIDACLQASIMGGTAGNISTLKAFVPVFISECRIAVPQRGSMPLDSDGCKIYTRMEKTGFATRKIDCTLRRPCGTPAVDMKNVRLSLYTGKAPVQAATNVYLQRHPCLRVLWKPDILRLYTGAESQVQEYVNKFAAQQSADMKDNQSLVVLNALLELASHKNPRMRVLELGGRCSCTSKQSLELLGKDTAFPRCRSWNVGNIGEDGKLSIEEGESTAAFDVVLIPHHSTSSSVWSSAPEQLTSLVSDQSIIITRTTKAAISSLKSAGFELLELPSETLLAIHGKKATKLAGKQVLIIKPNESSSTQEAIASSLGAHFKKNTDILGLNIVPLNELDSVELSSEVICIPLLETERELLATISSQDMDRLRKITDVVTNLIWLTGANMMTAAPNPNLTLSNGLSRALMLEQPALRFTIIDLGAADLTRPEDMLSTCENVIRALIPRHSTDDCEYIQKDRLLYISRFAPDLDLNSLFRRRLEQQESMEMVPLEEVAPARLSIGQVGVTDTIHFQQISEPFTKPPAGFVDIDVKAVSLNAKDIYAMSGRVETHNSTTALDFSGVVSAVGADVTHLKPGDRVVAWAPNHFGTTERVPAASVHKMLPTEDLTVLPTLLTVYCTALYALRDRAQLRAGESILIHAGAGAFGLAAIAMAQRMGATVYTTVGSQVKRDFLIAQMGVPAERIFHSRNVSFAEDIKTATGNGVDVIVNSLVGDLMHASWACLAPFGRFVEIGKRELIDAGKLDMHVFLRNTTLTAFDMSEFFFAEDPFYRNIWNSLMAEVLDLYRASEIKPPPITTFDVSDIAQAYRYFNNKDRVGKVVISMENGQSRVPVSPAQYKAVFDPEKSYLLVGCLGGLGRSLSRWMMIRGARKFVFLGRSGCDKPTAQQLVSRLRNSGASVTVVRGDVSDSAHVHEAVLASAAAGVIGGVVQAAMGLREGLFTRMTNDAWHIGIQPKWKGTWNLHHALKGYDDALDFFLMTSSVSGSVGTATESNYCAANGFLDAFAHWRRAQGKPAVSVGLGMISEVGYLHENPDIGALLLRKGVQPLNEEEFLQVLDFSLAGPGGETNFNLGVPMAAEAAHILTGLEPFGIRKLMEKGFDVSTGTMEDPRTGFLSASLLAEQDAQNKDQGADLSQFATAAEWVKVVPASERAIFASEAHAPSMQDAILGLTKKRFSGLILMPLDQVDEHRPLPSFGVDSMLAAEFRTWFWNTFKVDIPFINIVSPQKTLWHLAEYVEEKLVASWQG
ncbi:polyketide synthase-like protein [Hypoxylon crocopeplum]|nr:polyketide synthase-like protein [Hypoxylon crocopeplum]